MTLSTIESLLGKVPSEAKIGYASPEDFRAYVRGTNWQPAWQACADYCAAHGLTKIKAQQRQYDLWCPLRTTSYFSADLDGRGLVLKAGIVIEGVDGNTTLTFKNSIGGANSTVTQHVDLNGGQAPWRGGGFWFAAGGQLYGTGTRADLVGFKNLILDGTETFASYLTNAGQDISHKGIAFPQNDWSLLEFDNVYVHHFNGELYYLGGDANSIIRGSGVRGAYSQQSGWNPTGLGRVVFDDDFDFHDCYLASEIISGAGHSYGAGRFANCFNCGTIGTEFFATGYFYGYPNRDTTRAPNMVQYNGTRFVNCSSVTVGTFTRGVVESTDTYFAIGGQDIKLKIRAFTDQHDGSIIASFSGPPTDTTQSYQCPVGVYDGRPKNVHVEIEHYRTKWAIDHGFTNINALQFQGGLIDKASVSFTLTGEFNMAVQRGQYPVAGEVLPLIITKDCTWLVQPGGGDYSTPSGNLTVTPSLIATALTPSGSGVLDLIMATSDGTHPYAVTDGQVFTFHVNGGSGRPVRARASGNGFTMREDRIIAPFGDELQVQWNDQTSSWMEYRHKTSRAARLTGSATYDPPSLAAGAKTGIQTMTINGVVLGDFIEDASFSNNLAGAQLRAWVSASDTASYYFINENGANPLDLGSGTVSLVARRAP